MLDIQAE